MNKRIILLVGYARSGKDTIADYLVDNYNYKKLKFAGPLYNMLVAMYSYTYTYEQFEQMKANDESIPGFPTVTVRQFLQWLGTEFGRDMISPDIWTKLVKERINCFKTETNFVISDCRFLNEVNIFNNDNTFDTSIWYVDRAKSNPQTHHRSEMEIYKISKLEETELIDNNNSIQVLLNSIDKLFP